MSAGEWKKTISDIQSSDVKTATSGAASTVIESDLPTNKVVISDGTGKITTSAITKNELASLDAISADKTIETRLSDLEGRSFTQNTVLVSGDTGDMESSNITTDELDSLDGIKTDETIQNQIDNINAYANRNLWITNIDFDTFINDGKFYVYGDSPIFTNGPSLPSTVGTCLIDITSILPSVQSANAFIHQRVTVIGPDNSSGKPETFVRTLEYDRDPVSLVSKTDWYNDIDKSYVDSEISSIETRVAAMEPTAIIGSHNLYDNDINTTYQLGQYTLENTIITLNMECNNHVYSFKVSSEAVSGETTLNPGRFALSGSLIKYAVTKDNNILDNNTPTLESCKYRSNTETLTNLDLGLTVSEGQDAEFNLKFFGFGGENNAIINIQIDFMRMDSDQEYILVRRVYDSTL